jgi:glycosyltransferase involved in cell wall biosynthesis
MTLEKISVVIPAFNSERFIVASIRSVINQDYGNVEIICVDDGSVDGTEREVTANFPSVHYLRQSNRGPAAARNLGIAKSTGEYVAFLDSDDIWLPEKLSLQMECIARDPTIKILHTNVKLNINGVLTDSIYPTNHQEGRIFDNLLLQNGSVVCSTLLVKRECLQRVGGFDEELRTSEDVHLFLRLAHHYDFHFLNKALVIKNHHDTNLTNLNNTYYGAGSILALEKIEHQFPQYAREHSKVMRRAFFQRARLKAAGFFLKGENITATMFLIRAFNYDRTIMNFVSLVKQGAKACLGQAMRRARPEKP